MKVCIIAIAKNENKYIQEWIDWHLGLGVDNVFICDNNDVDGEKMVVRGEKVNVLNYRGVRGVQTKAYTECFVKYREGYDWLIFIDVDEFIVMEDGISIKEFLSRFNGVDIIRLCWKVFTGDSILNKGGVVERFKTKLNTIENCWGKSIISGKMKYVGGYLKGHGYFDNPDLIVVSACGDPVSNKDMFICSPPVYKRAWINHYPTKTLNEFLEQKFNRGGPNGNDRKYHSMDYFHRYNLPN